MTTCRLNVTCRSASNQLLAYDSHYLHLSWRVSGAQLGLRGREGLPSVGAVRGGRGLLLDQFCRLLYWLGLTLTNGCVKGARCKCVCVRVCVIMQRVVTVSCFTEAFKKRDPDLRVLDCTSTRTRPSTFTPLHPCGLHASVRWLASKGVIGEGSPSVNSNLQPSLPNEAAPCEGRKPEVQLKTTRVAASVLQVSD